MIRGYGAYSGVTLTATYGVTVVGNNFAVDPNCVALWRFEAGKLTLDSIKTNKLKDVNSVDVNTVDYKEGAAAAQLDWADGEYFSIIDANLSSGFPFKNGTGNSKISLCFWVKFDTMTPWPCVFSKNLNAKYGFGISKTSLDKLEMFVGYNSGTNAEIFVHDATLLPDRWYHVGATFDNSSKSYRIRIWDATAHAILGTDKTGTAVHSVVNDSGEVQIGHSAGLNRFLYNLDGTLDEFVVFNDILSVADIDKIRQGTYGKP